MRGALALAMSLLLAACTGALPPMTGVPAVAPAMAAELKTKAVHGARDEIRREYSITLRGVYLDTLVGPTPEEYLYSWAHPQEWLEAMVATKLVDGTFGVPATRGGIPVVGFAIEVGGPYPAGRDTLEIIYAWCARPFPTTQNVAGPASVWRDAFVPSDTGWTRLRHLTAVAISACSP